MTATSPFGDVTPDADFYADDRMNFRDSPSVQWHIA